MTPTPDVVRAAGQVPAVLLLTAMVHPAAAIVTLLLPAAEHPSAAC